MPNNVRVNVSAPGAKQSSSEVDSLRDKFAKLQSTGAKGFAIGAGAAITAKAFSLLDTAIGGAIGVMGDAEKAALEDEESQSRLRASLQANVPAWNGNTDAIEATILARQKLGFTDEDQRKSLALLVAATHDSTKALEINRTAMDLARLKGISLEEASSALVKVEGGQFRMLKSLGIVLKDGATAQDALTAVQKVATGQAESYANTNQGKLLASQIKVSEAMEKLGYKIMPGVVDITSKAADAVVFLVDALDQIKPVTDAAGGGIQAIAEGLDGWTEAIGTEVRAIGDLLTATDRTRGIVRAGATDWTKAGQVIHESAGKIADDHALVGGSALTMSEQVAHANQRIRNESKRTKRDLLGDASKLVDDYFDVLIAHDELSANSAEMTELRRKVAAGKATKEEIRQLHRLEQTQVQLLDDLASHGKSSDKEYEKAMKGLLSRLKHAHGEEKKAIEAEILKLQLLAIQANIAKNAVGAAIAKGGYVNASGAEADKQRARGGPVGPGFHGTVGEEGIERLDIGPNGVGMVTPLRGASSGGGGSWSGGNTGGGITIQIPTTIVGMPSPGQIQQWARDAAPALARELQRQRLL